MCWHIIRNKRNAWAKKSKEIRCMPVGIKHFHIVDCTRYVENETARDNDFFKNSTVGNKTKKETHYNLLYCLESQYCSFSGFSS